ncbi:malectin domain-containing carbohydrate-binding protein [Persicobacter diffluens]|uniref:Malectin domain-containing protein n=2 Tax=Persicobacter diffluens TaxID=981 RepID=A0AAN4W4U8_9BACT|nr:hypothetical protein PEDI_51420 [Persicobacter diffluens]
MKGQAIQIKTLIAATLLMLLGFQAWSQEGIRKIHRIIEGEGVPELDYDSGEEFGTIRSKLFVWDDKVFFTNGDLYVYFYDPINEAIKKTEAFNPFTVMRYKNSLLMNSMEAWYLYQNGTIENVWYESANYDEFEFLHLNPYWPEVFGADENYFYYRHDKMNYLNPIVGEDGENQFQQVYATYFDGEKFMVGEGREPGTPVSDYLLNDVQWLDRRLFDARYGASEIKGSDSSPLSEFLDTPFENHYEELPEDIQAMATSLLAVKVNGKYYFDIIEGGYLWLCEYSPREVTASQNLKINAGGKTEVNGYLPDAELQITGSSRIYQTSRTEDVLYNSHRYGKDFQYQLPIPNGRYEVSLVFKEVYHDKIGKRIFSVDLQGENIIKDYSPNPIEGVVYKKFTAKVTDEKLNIRCYTGKYGIDNAMISAITVKQDFTKDKKINAGSSVTNPAMDLGEGIDRYYTSGKSYSRDGTDFIENTERYGKDFSYCIPVKEAGIYKVSLYFNDFYWAENNQEVIEPYQDGFFSYTPRKRRFNVDINGIRVLDDFDLRDRMELTERNFYVEATDSLKIRFFLGDYGLDHAKVNAISWEKSVPVPVYIDAGASSYLSANAYYYQPEFGYSSDRRNFLPEDGYFQGGERYSVFGKRYRYDRGQGFYYWITQIDENTYNYSGYSERPPSLPYNDENTNDALKTERYGRDFSYCLPTIPGESYDLKLIFAEIYFKREGQRIFQVDIDGRQVISNLDIIKDAGGPYIEITKDLSFTAQHQTTKIRFYTGAEGVNNAKISGILLEPGDSNERMLTEELQLPEEENSLVSPNPIANNIIRINKSVVAGEIEGIALVSMDGRIMDFKVVNEDDEVVEISPIDNSRNQMIKVSVSGSLGTRSVTVLRR